jgi:hypothetical protein
VRFLLGTAAELTAVKWGTKKDPKDPQTALALLCDAEQKYLFMHKRIASDRSVVFTSFAALRALVKASGTRCENNQIRVIRVIRVIMLGKLILCSIVLSTQLPSIASMPTERNGVHTAV